MAHLYGSEPSCALVDVRHAKVRIAKRKSLHIFILCIYAQGWSTHKSCVKTLLFCLCSIYFIFFFLLFPRSFSFSSHFFGYCSLRICKRSHVDIVISLTSVVVIPLLCLPSLFSLRPFVSASSYKCYTTIVLLPTKTTRI